MNESPLFWLFVAFQVVLDIYIASVMIYWLIQKRRYGSFHPLSPFQHKDIHAARQLLYEFKIISQKTAVLLNTLQKEQGKILKAQEKLKNTKQKVDTFEPKVESIVTQAPPQPVAQPVTNLAEVMPQRDVRSLVQQGLSNQEIRLQTGASIEEINLVRALS